MGARRAERQTKCTKPCYPPTSCGASQGLVPIVRPTELQLSIHQYPSGAQTRAYRALRLVDMRAGIAGRENCCLRRTPFSPRNYNKEYFVGMVTHFSCFLSPAGGDASRGYGSRRHNAASPDLLRDRKGRIQLARCRFLGAKAGPCPIRIYGFAKDAEEKAFGGSELPVQVCAFRAESVALLGGWSLFSLIYLQEGCET
jgi:hypothetical protein